MSYRKWQQKYAELLAGKPHLCGIEIIGELERAIEAKDALLVAYRLRSKPSVKTFDALKRWDDFNK